MNSRYFRKSSRPWVTEWVRGLFKTDFTDVTLVTPVVTSQIYVADHISDQCTDDATRYFLLKPFSNSTRSPKPLLSGAKKHFQIVTHICYKVSLFHGLVDLNILGDILGPSEHFPSEKIPGGKMAISKLAWNQLTLGALSWSWASCNNSSLENINRPPLTQNPHYRRQ